MIWKICFFSSTNSNYSCGMENPMAFESNLQICVQRSFYMEFHLINVHSDLTLSGNAIGYYGMDVSCFSLPFVHVQTEALINIPPMNNFSCCQYFSYIVTDINFNEDFLYVNTFFVKKNNLLGPNFSRGKKIIGGANQQKLAGKKFVAEKNRIQSRSTYTYGYNYCKPMSGSLAFVYKHTGIEYYYFMPLNQSIFNMQPGSYLFFFFFS